MQSVLLIGSPTDAEPAAAELGRALPDVRILLAANEGEIERGLDQKPAVVVLALGEIGLDLGAAQKLWRGRGLALPCVVLSREYDDELLRSVMRAGAADFVSRDQLARLGPALTRELVREKARRAPARPTSGGSSRRSSTSSRSCSS
jgi:DNA-binding NarL/FixJ family response regulator